MPLTPLRNNKVPCPSGKGQLHLPAGFTLIEPFGAGFAGAQGKLPVVRKRKRCAFTLIELLVVVVIIAITAGMVIPYVINTDDLEVASAARMISSDLQYAQNVAITAQAPITVSFNTVGDSYTLSNASGPLIHPMSKSDFVIDFPSQRGFESLNIVSADFAGAAAVTFDEIGSPDNAGTITLQAGSFLYVINVAVATGKVTVAASGS